MPPNLDTPSRILTGYTHDVGDYEEVPKGFGLLIRLNSVDGSVTLQSVPDYHCTEIHPNCYIPASLAGDTRLLHGGGSGTAVFFGQDDQDLGAVVMKHGNAKDTKEVLSLAAITQELIHRSTLSPDAADAMKDRIPRFLMLYVSPYHLRDRGKELWASLRGGFWGNSDEASWGSDSWESQRFGSARRSRRESHGGQFGGPCSPSPAHASTGNSEREVFAIPREAVMTRFSPHALASDGMRGMRYIRVQKTVEEDTFNDNSSSVYDAQKVIVDVGLTAVNLEIPQHFFEQENESKIAEGITFLQQLMVELMGLQEENNWKVTLGQSAIGGEHPLNGADVLTNGILTDELRTQLVDEFVTIMKDLRSLTWEEEKFMVDDIRIEVEELAKTQDVSNVSKRADSFVGSAIRKNYHPVTGRFVQMRKMGKEFRSDSMHLLDQEKIPAAYIGILLRKGTKLSDIFLDPPANDPTLDLIETQWLALLQQATSLRTTAATDCVWTCGLTDAGLHNTFLSKTRGLELFDLGAPGTMPQPAFLTKFLMSFFHTAGMQPDGSGSWVCRFEVEHNKLVLTTDTEDLIPYLDSTFSVVLRRLVDELFEGDKEVESLLVKYVVVQLLSDAAFCLDRFGRKGGGCDVRHSKGSRELSKWLWRSLWDFYIASHVHSTYLKA